LTPTFRDVNKRFSTRYYLNLVLIDEENRRYFKQQVRKLNFLLDLHINEASLELGNYRVQDTGSKSFSSSICLPLKMVLFRIRV